MTLSDGQRDNVPRNWLLCWLPSGGYYAGYQAAVTTLATTLLACFFSGNQESCAVLEMGGKLQLCLTSAPVSVWGWAIPSVSECCTKSMQGEGTSWLPDHGCHRGCHCFEPLSGGRLATRAGSCSSFQPLGFHAGFQHFGPLRSGNLRPGLASLVGVRLRLDTPLCAPCQGLCSSLLGQEHQKVDAHEEPAPSELQARDLARARQLFDLVGRAAEEGGALC
jgi:hypothetical protein